MDEKHERVVASFATQGLMDTLGARLGSVTAGEVQIDMPFSSRLSQQNSYVHAGAITSIVDSACGYAAMTEAPPDHGVVTVEFKVNFMRPAIGEYFRAIGRVINAGRQLTVCSGEARAFTGDDYKTIAVMQATIANIRT